MVRYRRTLSTAKRLNEIVGMLMRFGFEELIEQDAARDARTWLLEKFGKEPLEQKEQGAPERARLLLQELGPTFVKFGQMAASQSSRLPEEWVEELSQLQSSVAPVSADEVVQVITEELGAPPDELFGSFELEALAAASIGQVHRATLTDETPVAVKIQRPNIVPKIEEDLTIMHDAAVMLERTSEWARDFGAAKAVDEFAKSLMEELDYRHEGRNTELLGRNVSDFPQLRTASIHWDYSTERVLTMEFVTGVRPTAREALDEAGVDCEALARDFVRCMSQQILIDGFFHADPHPGNMTINLEQHDLIFLDTGMMGLLDKSERRELMQLMLAVQQRDAPSLAKIAMYLGTPVREVDKKALSHDLERLLRGMLDPPLSEVGGGRFFTELLQLLQEHGVRLPSGMVMALKSLMQMLEVVVSLYPGLTFAEVSQIVAHELTANQFKSSSWKAFGEERMMRLQVLAPLVDDAIEEMLRQATRGSINVELRGLNLSKETQVISTIGRHFTQALLLGGATIGSAIAMSSSVQGSWSFVPVLGAIGFLVSMLLSIWLLLQDVRKDE